MKPFILAAAGLVALSATASAQTVIREESAGVHSAPVAGATPQARENPSPGTTMLETREKTTVIDGRPAGGAVDADPETTGSTGSASAPPPPEAVSPGPGQVIIERELPKGARP